MEESSHLLCTVIVAAGFSCYLVECIECILTFNRRTSAAAVSKFIDIVKIAIEMNG